MQAAWDLVLITGASPGRGRALPEASARPGAVLHLSGRDAARLDAVAAACRARGAQVHPAVLDVTDQAAMAAWGKWFEELGARGQLVNGGSPLDFDGRRITKHGLVTDIAASELKELVSGYSIIKAESYAAAVEIAKGCPIFRISSAVVEVRGVEQM